MDTGTNLFILTNMKIGFGYPSQDNNAHILASLWYALNRSKGLIIIMQAFTKSDR